MKPVIFTLFVLSFLVSGITSQAVTVYRFPEGRFSSGDIPKERLYLTGETRNFTWIKSTAPSLVGQDTKTFWIPRNSVSSSLDLSHHAIATVSTPYYNQPFVVAKPRGHFKFLTNVDLLSRDQDWFHIEFKIAGKKVRGWIPENLLQASPTDRGRCLTSLATPLKQFANAESKNMTTIPAGVSLEPLGLHNSWIKVKYLKKTGWVSFYQMISKLNFAKKIQSRGSSEMREVTAVSGNWLTLADGSMVSVDQVIALETTPFKMIVTSNNVKTFEIPSTGLGHVINKLPFGETLPVNQVQDIVWVRAGDGEGNAVWYQPKAFSALGVTKPLSPDWDLKTIVARGLFDVTNDPNNPKIKYASAKGVFRTLDGVHWQPLTFFGNLNEPLAVSESGEIYVGSYVSHNGGRTFSPYLKWDNVFGKIVRARGNIPENLRLIRVVCDKERLLITLGFGRRTSPGVFS